LPLALASAGLGTAWLGSISPVVAPFRTPLLIVAAALLLIEAAGLVSQFRRARTCPTDTACGSPTYRVLTAAGLLIGTTLLAGAVVYD
jgi:mercuric ion transport protein